MGKKKQQDKKNADQPKVKKKKEPCIASATQRARKMKRIETQMRRELKKRCKLAGCILALDSLMGKRGQRYKENESREDPNASKTTLGGLSFGTAHRRMRRYARRQTLVGPPLPKRKPKSQSLVTREKVGESVHQAAEEAGIKL